MTTTTDILTIDRDDLNAIRKADSVVFRHYQGVATIECIKRDRDEFGDKERRRDIVVAGSISHSSWNYEDRESFSSACTSITSAGFHEGWRTINAALRIGDSLKLEFRADEGTNGYVKDANLHADELWLRVERGEGAKRNRLFFLLDSTICPSNSARMVQR
jgi:hypothetical protein